MEYLAIVPILAFLIVIHELGHFFGARSVGVKVEEFGVGLPPRIKGWKRGGVLWSLNALPIGGFVRVKGEDVNDREPGSMQNASPWARGWFLLAGPLANLLMGVILSIALVASTGVQTQRPFISTVVRNSPAEQAGWLPGDRIVSIDGEKIETTTQAIDVVRASVGNDIDVVIQRGNEQLTTQVTPRENPPQGEGSTGIIFGDGLFSTVQVDTILPNTPAAAAGLQPGDSVVEIDGVKIEAMAQAMAMMDARFGEDVQITVEREGQPHTVNLAVSEPALLISSVVAGSPVSRAELYATDEITSFNGETVTNGQAFLADLIAHSGEDVELGYVRTTAEGRVDLTTTLSIPDISKLESTQVLANLGFSVLESSGFHQAGISPVGLVSFEPVPANRMIPEGWHQFTSLIGGTFEAVRVTFSGDVPMDSLVGPIGMGQMTGEMLDAADGNRLPVILSLSMLISVSLGLFNLLPIPALDGGRLMFVLLEILRGGRRIPPEKEGMVHLAGMLFLMGLIFFIAYGDVSRILNGDSLIR